MAADDRLTHPGGPEDELARRLRETQRRVRTLAVPCEERARLAKRLLAICNTAKRDIPHATARLDGFIAYLDGEFDTPSEDQIT
ncbi:hypothetical protein GCM10009555_081900 [Acrocarpospora macrocephala]|uniref:Uncharacterized protein n=1 Tax=Acrocarpospora macrocephala TaxID=150177 RepID=A0A5M3WUG8_9ACTN|nr:hypothetical protein [Acrocarpospora macrocephala]GES10921.1 hypothetical protein Amac_045180 [Acrocarpospora macrocephala]